MAIDKAAKSALKVVDQFAGNLFGGTLQKAKLVAYKDPELTGKAIIDGGPSEIHFFLNPTSVTVSKSAKVNKDETNQQTPETKFASTEPVCLKLGELWFDTYDTRESVRKKYIDPLESLLDYVPNTHVLPVVTLVWGQFSQMTKALPRYIFYVTALTVDYTMFLPDATPVRAKVSIGLEQASIRKLLPPKESPDHAKLYTVKRGDTLQGIAMAEYENPAEWRRIAKTNKIDNPFDLAPGTKLLVPPILK